MTDSKSIFSYFGFNFPVVNAKHVEGNPEPTLRLKPSEIPIYEDLDDFYSIEYYAKPPGKLEEGASVVRKELETLVDQTKEVRDKAIHIYETGKAHTLTTKEYILDEDNAGARFGAITVGAFTGLLLASRKSFFKKILYSVFGGGAVASSCYPKEAYAIGEDLVKNAEMYANVGYNFVMGAKPNEKSEEKIVVVENVVPYEEPIPMPSECGVLVLKPTRLDNVEKFEDILIDALLDSQIAAGEASLAESEQATESQILTAYNEATNEEALLNDEANVDTMVNLEALQAEFQDAGIYGRDSKVKVSIPSKDALIKATVGKDSKIDGDFGQSNPEDRDMYTTRS